MWCPWTCLVRLEKRDKMRPNPLSGVICSKSNSVSIVHYYGDESHMQMFPFWRVDVKKTYAERIFHIFCMAIIIINKHHHHQLAQLFLVGSSSPRGHVPIFAWDRGKGAVIPACPVLYSCILLGVYTAVWVKYSYILSILILAWPVELRPKGLLRPPFQLCCSREWCL